MSILDKSTPTQLQGGLNKDMTFQKQGDVTFALNAIRDSHDGGKYEYQSEPGNEQVLSIPTSFSYVGSINGNDNEVFIFATDNNGTGTIARFKEGKYTEIVRTDFDWSTAHPISGEFRVKNGCENIIYWCDGNTWDGHYNFDRPELFQDGSGNWVPNKFKLVPDVLPPNVDLLDVNDFGGNLYLGSYYFQPEILDANLNSIYIGDVTPQVIIFDDSQNLNYFDIDGGLNINQYSDEIGGVPITNKSISLRFSNLDTSFKYLRINVFRSISGTQVIDAHSVGKLIPIGSSTIDWTYQGYDPSAGDFPIDASEKLVDNIRYESAYVMEQVQNRLVKANLKESVVDYSSYQSFVSQITAKWISEEYRLQNIDNLGDCKNPKTYWYKRGYQGDDVILPGIRFLHRNGAISPVFPLIGRPKTADDEELLTVVDNAAVLNPGDVWLSDVQHLGLNIGETVEKWKVFNTATITFSQTTDAPYYYEGEFSYYESDTETYPDIRNCDNDIIWGNDSNGDPITSDTKLRLFKFPDRRLVHHIDKRDLRLWARPFGIKFDNIVYPNSDVIAHQFVMAERTEFDKTVQDCGWSNLPRVETEDGDVSRILSFLYTPTGQDFFSHFNNFADDEKNKYIRFISPNLFYEDSLTNFSYFKTNSVCSFDSGILFTDGVNNYPLDEEIYSAIFPMNYESLAIPLRTNHNEQQSIIVRPGTITTPVGLLPEIQSYDYYTKDSISYIDFGLENTTALLPAQVYDTGLSTNGDSRIKVHNFYTYKKSINNPYSNFLTRNYFAMHYNFNSSLIPDDNAIYGGDTIITENSNFRLAYFSQGAGGLNIAATPHFKEHFVESNINSSLRHEGSVKENKYFKVGDGDETNWERLIVDRNAASPQTIRNLSEIIPEYYAYNKDFTFRSFEKSKINIPDTFDYCSECSGSLPNRIVFSPKSFDEESFDLYRINKVNDYITIPAHRGKITGLKYQNDYLLVHTENSLFILQPNPQSLATDISSVYLTTGGFLSLPPTEIIQNDIGYAGCQHKQHFCETPFGHAWCDQKRGQIFLFDTKLQELSAENKGMTQWFKQELPSYLQSDFYNVMSYNYPNTSTYDITHDGVGLIMYYDPRFKRLMISKKDYKPINFKLSPSQSFDIFYDEAVNNWKVYTPVGTPVISFSSTNYFENKSWTISYTFSDQTFTSWHSYRPLAAFSDNSHFYTLFNTVSYLRLIYRHKHLGDYQKYYGTKYYFIVEWLTADASTDAFNSIHYNGYALSWDDTNKKWMKVDSTFHYGMVYSFDQSSDTFPITLANQHTNPYANIGFSNTSKYAIRTDNNYKISGIYDVATGSPVVTSDWNFLKNFPGYIDQLALAANHDNTKTAYQLGLIKDKFVYCRLFYNPNQDYKKIINLLQVNEMKSIR